MHARDRERRRAMVSDRAEDALGARGGRAAGSEEQAREAALEDVAARRRWTGTVSQGDRRVIAVVRQWDQ